MPKQTKITNQQGELLSDLWSTPDWVFDQYNKEFGQFDLDVCANQHNKKCDSYLDRNDDALNIVSWWITDWSKSLWEKDGAGYFRPTKCWMNPPYSNVTPWLKKAKEEAQNGCLVVCLLKHDHTTKWWKDYIFDYSVNKPYPGVEIRPVPKRVKFIPPPGMVDKNGKPVKSITPPWPSTVVIFHPYKLF